MFKLCIVLFAALAYSSAKPTLVAAPLAYTAGAPLAYTAGAPLAYTAGAPLTYTAGAPLAYTAPLATSSQYVARNYNGVVSAAPLTYPYASAYSYPYASGYSAYSTYPYASAAYVV